MKTIPFNYCITCGDLALPQKEYCVLHKNNQKLYCSNCGTLLNPLLAKPAGRHLCAGCQFAFAYPSSTPISTPAHAFIEYALSHTNLPVHVRQAYERQLHI